MPTQPRIAILLDENTSADGTRYEVNKAYFRAVRDAGGLPYGIAYLDELIAGLNGSDGGEHVLKQPLALMAALIATLCL